jgi:hypothetical protein
MDERKSVSKKTDDKFSEQEIKLRLDAALRGARLAGPKHNESLTPKRVRKRKKLKGRLSK